MTSFYAKLGTAETLSKQHFVIWRKCLIVGLGKCFLLCVRSLNCYAILVFFGITIRDRGIYKQGILTEDHNKTTCQIKLDHIYSVPTGQGKLEKVRELSSHGKVRGIFFL